jgi:hypothetical protein
LVTPDVSHDPAEPGNCNYCHDAGTDVASGVEAVDNHDTHHGTGVYKDRYGNTADLGGGETMCGWCHKSGSPHAPGGHDADRIRTCENCHGMESLHNIQADSDGSGDIVIGGELAGYGHVGADDPGSASDCWGCHGFSMGSASAPGSGVIAPTIDGADLAITANTDASVTVSGNAFTNDAINTAYIVLTSASGAKTNIVPDSLSVDSITATINVPAGIYSLRVVKGAGYDWSSSNPVVLIVKDDTSITITSIKASCGSDCDGTLVIEGSGFGGYVASAGDFLNVMHDGVELTITTWTDTKIEATGAVCNETGEVGEITLNGIFGSATK